MYAYNESERRRMEGDRDNFCACNRLLCPPQIQLTRIGFCKLCKQQLKDYVFWFYNHQNSYLHSCVCVCVCVCVPHVYIYQGKDLKNLAAL